MNKYEIGKTIDKGSFGKVKLATKKGDLFHTKYAIKLLSKRKCRNTEIVEREITILNICDHPNIVQCMDHFSDEKRYYIVMEYVDKGNLYDYVVKRGKLKEKLAKKFFTQIVSVIEYCHGNLIAHRDLKLENILLTANNTIKIVDFGLANFIKVDTLHKTYCGSPHYSAPEILLHEEYNPMLSDIFSMGIILYVFLTGHFPWDMTAPKVIDQITKCFFQYPSYVSDDAKDLISHILVPEPLERYRIDQMKEHIWLKKYVLDSHLKERNQVRNIDLIIVEKIVSLGFDRSEVLVSLAENTMKQSTAIYYLLMEKYNNNRGKRKAHKKVEADDRSYTEPELLNKRLDKYFKHEGRKKKSISPTFLRKNPEIRNIL